MNTGNPSSVTVKILYEVYKRQPVTHRELQATLNMPRSLINTRLRWFVAIRNMKRFRPNVALHSPIPYKYIVTPSGARYLHYLGLIDEKEYIFYKEAIYPELLREMKEYEKMKVKVKKEVANLSSKSN